MSQRPPVFESRGRIMPLFCIFVLFVGLIGYRVVSVQVVRSGEFSRWAVAERMQENVVPARRGEIFDARGVRLATNVPANRVSAILDQIVDKHAAAEQLAPLIERPAAEIEDALNQTDLEWVLLARQLSPEASDQIAALNIDGIVLDPEPSRIYPFGAFGSHLLGFTNDDLQGNYGVEGYYNDLLDGTPGKLVGERDALGNVIGLTQSTWDSPVDGADLGAIVCRDRHTPAGVLAGQQVTVVVEGEAVGVAARRAIDLGVVPAVLSGIFLAEYTSARRRSTVKPVVDLLAGIPSVVYGLWGVLFVVPLIREVIAPAMGGLARGLPFLAVRNPSGYSVLAGAIVLAIMVFPLIVAVTDEVLRNIPAQLRESGLALGATRWETTWMVVRRQGLPGIAAAVVLAFSRAFGETLAIMMVIGNTPAIPRSIFDAAYPLPALIANAYSEMMSVPQYRSALMLAALVLLCIVLLLNLGARRVIMRLGARM